MVGFKSASSMSTGCLESFWIVGEKARSWSWKHLQGNRGDNRRITRTSPQYLLPFDNIADSRLTILVMFLLRMDLIFLKQKFVVLKRKIVGS